MISGKISYYNNAKQFGFIEGTVENEAIFFHLSKQRQPACNGGDKPDLSDICEVEPKVGDTVLLEVTPGPKGLKALYWCREDLYQLALEAIEERPTFRLVKRNGRVKKSRLQPAPDLTILYEGKDLLRLRTSYCKQFYAVCNKEFFGLFFQVYHPSKEAFLDCDDPR